MTTDPGQRAVLRAGPEVSASVIGAPGTGKTFTLVERVVALLGDRTTARSDEDAAGAPLLPEEILVLTPSRHAATSLRDRIGTRIPQATPGPLARSLGSLAYQLVRGAAARTGAVPPALLTGADQDRIVAELLAGDAEDALSGQSRWPESLGAALRASRGFRSELRAFIDECTELRIEPAELRRTGNERWAAAADFIVSYRRVLARMRAGHRDTADLLSEAAAIVRFAPEGQLGALAALRVVLIDDAQELTSGGVALVDALRARGVAVIAFGDPDISSGAFRGATPDVFAELSRLLGRVFVLDTPHRQKAALTRCVRETTQSIGAAGRVEHRRPPAPSVEEPGAEQPPGAEDGEVAAFLAASPHEETDRIAGTLRDWHVTAGIPWERMAVIAHDTRQVTQLETELAAREVPTRAAGVQRPLGREQAVRDILQVIRIALVPGEERDPDELAELLRSPFGGLDAVGLRRLRARLRHAELREGGSTSARELLRDAIAAPASLVLIDAPEARAAERFARTLAETASGAARAETIHELLWRVWDRARTPEGRALSAVWREDAERRAGAESGRALDALVALFDAAKRFVERTPEATPLRFLADILDSEVPEDSLSSPARQGQVALHTPATALGTEYDAVVIAGMQDGVWPNLRLRGGMLETWRLPQAVAALRGGEDVGAPGLLDRRRGALHDELRLLVRALSRARSRLLVTAVDDDDLAPSPFLRFLPEPPSDDTHAAREHPLTLRGLVGRYRRTLTSAAASDRDRDEAVRQLAVLAREGVPGAHPDEWYGAVPASTDAPLRDPVRRPVRVSPSRMEAFEACALDWAIRALGGDTKSWSQGLGTILHAAMEEVPDGDLEGLRRVVDARWGELEFDAAWLERKERRWADVLVGRLHSYLSRVHREGGRLHGAELSFELEIDLDAEGGPRVLAARPSAPPEGDPRPRAVLSGAVDRVEVFPAGRGEALPVPEGDEAGERAVIVDLKTGRSEERVTDAKVRDDAQLSAYQLAYAMDALRSDADGDDRGAPAPELAGSRLVVLSRTLKGTQYRIAHQPPHDDEERTAFIERVAADARGMAGDHFIARIDTHCRSARFAVCRLHTIKAVSSS